MERIEVPEEGRVSEWVAAVERGDEVVIVRDGRVVAEVKASEQKARPIFDPVKLARLHATLGPLAGADGAAIIRALRDEEDI